MSPAVDRALLAVGRTLWRLRVAPLVRWFGRNRPKVLLYHACEPDESPWIAGLEVNCPPETFRAQLDHLARHYRVVPIEELESGDVPPGAVAITFDDGYRSVIDHAMPLLAERNMPAAAYLVTGVVDNRDIVWVNELNWLLRAHPAVAAPRSTAVWDLPPGSPPADVLAAAVQGYDPDAIEGLLDAIWDEVGGREQVVAELDLYLSWDQARAARDAGVVTFGSHTVSHPDLRRVDDERLRAEVDDSIAEITRELGSCTSFAFPFGFADERALLEVEARPLRSVLLVGSTHPPRPPRRRSRSSITSGDDAQIFAELEVLAPAKALVRDVRRRLGRGCGPS